MVKVIVLGSGAACGVPTVSDGWGACDPQNSKNRRQRAGVYFEDGKTRILIDSSADLRNQLLTNQIRHLSAVFYTHTHADHTMGIDDLRAMNYHVQDISGMEEHVSAKVLNIYAVKTHMDEIRHRFNYVLTDEQMQEKTHRPQLCPHVIECGQELSIGSVKVMPLAFAGHTVPTTGYAFNNGQLVLIPDYKEIPASTLDYLQKIDVNVLIMPLTTIEESRYHAGIEIDKHYIEQICPKQVFFTHMGPECDYEQIRQICPKNVQPAFDNMVLEL